MTEPTKPNRKPWPMSWVVVAIAAFMAIYTVVNVGFRKKESPHLPYEEAQERSSRFFDFDMNGWTWLQPTPAGSLEQDAEPSDPLAVSARPLQGRLDQDLPMDLVTVIPKRPNLTTVTGSVEASLRGSRYLEIRVLPTGPNPVSIELEAFLKDGRLVILALKGAKNQGLEGPLTYQLDLPPDIFASGDCTAALYTAEAVYDWVFTIPEPVNSTH